MKKSPCENCTNKSSACYINCSDYELHCSYCEGYADAIHEFADVLKKNADIYTGECSCRKAISVDRVFEILRGLENE